MGNAKKAPDPVPFIQNACYTVEQVAEIIHRNPKTVRKMCRDKIIHARCDRGGYLIGGWAIRAYLECRLVSEL
jgi:hypothetical protein